MKKSLLSGVLGAALLGTVPSCGLAKAKANFEALGESVLVACQQGRYDDVYREASPAFRESATPEAFREYVDLRRRALGAFRRVRDWKGLTVQKTGGGPSIAQIAADVEYERGPAQVELEFREEGDGWRLGLLKIAFDEGLLEADPAALEPLARSLLDLYDASEFVALYARFSKPLQEAWPASKYETEIRTLRESTGKVQEATLGETKDEGGGKQRLHFTLTFENASGKAEIGFLDRQGEWLVIAFHLHRAAR